MAALSGAVGPTDLGGDIREITLAATNCGTSDTLAIAISGAPFVQVLYLGIVASGGTVARVDPEWHRSATVSDSTRLIAESWGAITPSKYWGAGAPTKLGVPIPVVSGMVYLRPKPDTADGQVEILLRYRVL